MNIHKLNEQVTATNRQTFNKQSVSYVNLLVKLANSFICNTDGHIKSLVLPSNTSSRTNSMSSYTETMAEYPVIWQWVHISNDNSSFIVG